MPRPRESQTYRLRQLPAYLDRSRVANFLVTSVEGLGPLENIVVYSLASSLIPWKQSPTKTATLMFKITPKCFDNDRTEWAVPMPDHSESLIFDTHFLEFTPLSDCDRNLHQFDCIAISGLASHPLGSWMHRGSETHFVWFRDRLPKDMPAIRPILYGYDTQLVKSESVQTIDDLAISFITRLKSIGRALLSAKPLIIIAHSLGGILLRNALIQMATSGDEEAFMLESIKMIICFGVPSRGMQMSHLQPMVEGQPNQHLVKLLSPDSDHLFSLGQQFSNIAALRGIRLISAYETKLSPTTQMSELGNWERTGPKELLVDKQSAVQDDSNPQDCFPINENHSDMVKFSDGSPEYDTVITFLHSILPGVVLDSSAVLEDEPLKVGGNKSSSKSRKWKADNVRDNKTSGLNADSLPSQPGLHAQPNSKKHHRQKRRKNAETSQHGRTKTQTKLEDLLDSLDFTERSQRYKRIADAHASTFAWIFERPELGLVSWLRKGTGIYWIQGKPGSGKSTLMKFLHDHPQTSEILNQWRQGCENISAWFFFNERGSHIQRSFEGLLRSVLRELISQNKRLAELVLEIYLGRVKQSVKEKQIWHTQDLQRALSAIISQQEQNIEVLLCLDALDEYSGPPEMIADFVQSLVQPAQDSRTVVKVLFSSRPWDAFVSNFNQEPGFKIHEQTKIDMRIFVLDKLGIIHALAELSNSAEASLNSTAEDIVSEIVDRAEGVFLWVRLVIESLLDAGPNATNLQLKERLQLLPDGLEKLYERTIERIPQSYRLEAFIVLELVNRARENLTVLNVIGAASCALGKTLDECVEILKQKLLTMDDMQAALQLKNLCGGLIETYRTKDECTRVQFMHQTVKDFVSRPGFERHMLGHSHAPLYENGFSFQMKYTLAMESPGLFRYTTLYDTSIVHLIFAARHAEETTGNDQEKFLDSMGDEYFQSQFFRHENGSYSENRPSSALSFAVLANLLLYTKKKLGTAKMVNELQKSLLHVAVDSIFFSDSPSSAASMIELLLENGADINHEFAGETPFEYLFSAQDEVPHKPIWGYTYEVFKVFLERGQDANIDLNFNKRYDGRNYVCKPLHATHGQAVQLLLQHGAHVNALDGGGLTALDRLIRRRYSSIHNPEDLATASILLEHGGCITHSTKTRLPGFISFMRRFSKIEVPDSFCNPPELPRTVAQRVRSILPAYLGGT